MMRATQAQTGLRQAFQAVCSHLKTDSLLPLATRCAAFVLWATAPDSSAQRYPDIGYIYPAGGQQGTTFRVRVGGQYLAGANEVCVSGGGVTAVVVDYDRPIAQKRVNEMRDKLKDVRAVMTQARKDRKFDSPQEAMKLFLSLAEEQGISLEELKKAAEFRRQRQDPKRQLNPQIAETVGLEVAIAPDAEPGRRELRLRTRIGLSNPLNFCVGQLPEVSEASTEPALTWEDLIGAGRRKATITTSSPDRTQRLTLPKIVNGQILPGEVDRFRFAARKGEHLVVAVSARALLPYLADAVPGWFQAIVAIYDSKGNEVAYDDDFRFHPDPLLEYTVPRDGDYTLEIRDSIYRGREDFVYRIALGELPFLTGIFPLGAEAGHPTKIRLAGWNLPVQTLSVQPDLTSGGLMKVWVTKDGRRSNPVLFAVGSKVECLEHEPNNLTANAQRITPPLVINGRVDQPGDWDIFGFEGRAGEQWVAEVVARRLDSPMDSILKLLDAKGRELAANDDCEDKATGLNTHHADSQLQARLPVDGVYYWCLGEAQGHGGDAYTYRLEVAPPDPHFELRIVPSTVNVRAGSSTPLSIHVLRRNGFTNEIALELVQPPSGFTLVNAHLTGETNLYQVPLKVSPTAPKGISTLRIRGRAWVCSEEVVRDAVPADDLMQAFVYRHLVPAQEMKVAVTGKAPPRKPSRNAGASTGEATNPVKSK